MKVLFNYKNHSLMNADLPIGKPNISLCKENSDKINDMHIFYDYPDMYDTEIEYLENTSNSYINTQLSAKYNTTVEFEYMPKSITTTANSALLQNKNYNWMVTQETAACYVGTWNGSFRVTFSTDPNNNMASAAKAFSLNTKYKIKLGPDGFYINDKRENYTPNWVETGRVSDKIKFFNTQGQQRGNLYYLKIWEADTLVRDYIPVKKNNIGYLFDKVSGQLYGNAGGGSFVCGSDLNISN